MRIRVEPDVLRGLSGQLQHAAEQIQQLTAGLEQALQSLDWDVSARETVLDHWMQAKRMSEQIHAYLHTSGAQLNRKAEEFQSVDHNYQTILSFASQSLGRPVTMLDWSNQQSPSILPGQTSEGSGLISNPQSVVHAITGIPSSDVGTLNQDILEQASSGSPQDWYFTDPSVVRDQPVA
ncbi:MULTISPECIES: WXG100 family type VII secretion target [Paenibacillus]|uniref:WXG100 family type VII secretion target n=1 Tax=Paenibacillus brasilensis TaxID=128574 RepID=A0ABU0L5W9_9BACL|nr:MULTISPECIES: WXG100 family type VII secretion target [Paenibacillus]MDQ0496644.1 WXG100 family type VII secretion target [Paenibacillus brasilensis]